jgi:hypothetical protein
LAGILKNWREIGNRAGNLKQGGKFENLAGNLKIWREIKKNWREV